MKQLINLRRGGNRRIERETEGEGKRDIEHEKALIGDKPGAEDTMWLSHRGRKPVS